MLNQLESFFYEFVFKKLVIPGLFNYLNEEHLGNDKK